MGEQDSKLRGEALAKLAKSAADYQRKPGRTGRRKREDRQGSKAHRRMHGRSPRYLATAKGIARGMDEPTALTTLNFLACADEAVHRSRKRIDEARRIQAEPGPVAR